MQVLIGRGLDHKLCVKQRRKHSWKALFNFEVTPQKAGVDGDEVTPVPIPNTEVKLISVENTWLATAWEDRAMPVQRRKDEFLLAMGNG